MTLTPAAAAELQRLLQEAGLPPEAGVLVSLRGGGCQGMTYIMDLLRAPGPHHRVVECEGVRVFLDPLTAPHIRGLAVDFVDDELNHGFAFRNPTARGTCGCGSSFAPREIPE